MSGGLGAEPLIGEGEAGGESADMLADFAEFGRVVAALDRFVDEISDIEHLVFLHTAGRNGGRTEADAAGLERALGVEGDGVLVGRDASLVEGFLDFLAGESLGLNIDEHDVIFRRAGDDAVAVFLHAFAEGLGVADDLLLIGLEGGLEGFFEADSFAGDDVFERATLEAGEYLGVNILGILGLAEDQTGAGTA